MPNGYYAGEVKNYGFAAVNCAPVGPEIVIGFWPRWPVEKPDATGWEQVEDHRERVIGGLITEEVAQKATEFWLPEDTYESPARTMKDPGPLPKAALLTRPEKPLNIVQDEKRREIDAAYEAALAGAVALADPSPSTVAIEAGLLAVFDPEGLEYVRDTLAARRSELLAAVDAATTPEDVNAIQVSYAV